MGRGVVVLFKASFQFLDPGVLRDDELELVAPHARWAEHMLAATNNPLTLAMEPHEPRVTRKQLADYLEAVPGGRLPGDAGKGRVPHYDFWMRVHDAPREPGGVPVPPMARIGGTITLRIGSTPALERYYG